MSEAMSDYRRFLSTKHIRPTLVGFDPPSPINSNAFPFQRDVIGWACRTGQCEMWEDCGLGKTLQLLECCRLATEYTHGKALYMTPLAVASQTIREAAKFSVDADIAIVKDQSECTHQINITNYERLHLFDPSKFDVVGVDESGILKNYVGATKRQLCEMFRSTPYRFGGSATPAPNDRKEIGNHSEFLGIMPSDEMLARWFINDTMKANGYVLRPFAAKDFWQWCSTWAVCISKPSDIGHDDTGYDLPPLNIHEHTIEPKSILAGMLFNRGEKLSATDVHREKRSLLAERCRAIADMVNADDDYWAVWCDTDYEADALSKIIPSAVEIRGSHPVKRKEEGLEAFGRGDIRVMITKPEIGGWGLNWQHCHKTTAFAGFSYERWYQCIRRLWRFGQKHPVDCHLIMTPNEESVRNVLIRKANAHTEMQSEMASLMREGMLERVTQKKTLKRVDYLETSLMPTWLQTKG